MSVPKNASDLIHQVIRDAFVASKIDNYTEAINELDQPPAWQTWSIGFAIISGCSFSAPLGILMLPFFSKSLYERIMTFLVAVGIGALSGSTIFIMLPQAFHLHELDDFDYHSKSMIILSALYAFFTVDRFLQYFLELRRRRGGARKVHASTLATMMTPRSRSDSPEPHGELAGMSLPAPNSRADVEKRELSELANDIELALTNNVLARTFSTRRRVAMMSGVDSIEFRPTSPSNRSQLGKDDVYRTDKNVDFIDKVNEQVKRRYSNCTASPEPPIITFKNVRHEDVESGELSVEVKVVEKRNIEPSSMEIASVAYMIIFGSSANNFVDGMSMGAAFSDNLLRGLSIGIAVISQQFPQELGVLAILIKSGLGLRRTLLFNMVPIVLSYLGFCVGVLLDAVDDSYDQYIFSVSSGMYMYIFLGTLIPEIRESTNELIKEDLAESFIVTTLHVLGIGFGTSFMYYMSTVGDVEL